MLYIQEILVFAECQRASNDEKGNTCGIGSFRNERQGRFGYHRNQITPALALLGVNSFNMSVMKDEKLFHKAMSMGTAEFAYSKFYEISNNRNNGQHFFTKTTCF